MTQGVYEVLSLVIHNISHFLTWTQTPQYVTVKATHMDMYLKQLYFSKNKPKCVM